MMLQEFPLWHNGIGGISGALGCRFNSQASTVGKGSSFATAVVHVQLGFRSDPWPGSSMCCRTAKKEKNDASEGHLKEIIFAYKKQLTNELYHYQKGNKTWIHTNDWKKYTQNTTCDYHETQEVHVVFALFSALLCNFQTVYDRHYICIQIKSHRKRTQY